MRELLAAIAFFLIVALVLTPQKTTKALHHWADELRAGWEESR